MSKGYEMKRNTSLLSRQSWYFKGRVRKYHNFAHIPKKDDWWMGEVVSLHQVKS